MWAWHLSWWPSAACSRWRSLHSSRPRERGAPGRGAGAGGQAQGRGRGQGRGGRAGGGPPRKRVLAWADTRNGQAQHESVGHALAIIERLGYDSGMWDTFIRTDSNIIAAAPKKTDGSPASGGPNLSNVDAIFFMGHREVPLDASQKAELLQFVRDGKGFVAAHVGLTALESWPEFGEMLGGQFDQHPISGPGTIINEGPNFPATKHFPATLRLQRRVLPAEEPVEGKSRRAAAPRPVERARQSRTFA